jgi:hypothetical protein
MQPLRTVLEERQGPDQEHRQRFRKNRRVSEGFKRFIAELSEDFHDSEHTKQNIAQARNLMAAAGLEESTFISAVYEARSITKQATIRKPATEGNGLRNKAPYFFAVLRNLLGLDEQTAPMQISDEELQRALDIQWPVRADPSHDTPSGPAP